VSNVNSMVQYLHDKNIVHRDLKSPNILLTQEGRSLKAKIADFGLAKISQSELGTTTGHAAMSLLWAAPEQFEDRPKISKAVDIFSFGVIMWEIVSMKLPHEGLGIGAVMRRVLAGQREEIPVTCPPPIAELIAKCWAQEAQDRPKAGYVREELMSIEICR
jgi:serine/threonine protein kinase